MDNIGLNSKQLAPNYRWKNGAVDIEALARQVKINTNDITIIKNDISDIKERIKNSIFLENLKSVSLLLPPNESGGEYTAELDLGQAVDESDIKILSTWVAYAGGQTVTYYRDIKQVGFYYNYRQYDGKYSLIVHFYPNEVKDELFIKNWSGGSLDFGLLYTHFNILPN